MSHKPAIRPLPAMINWLARRAAHHVHACSDDCCWCHTMQHLLPAWPAPDACASSVLWLPGCSCSDRACSSFVTAAWRSTTSSSIALQGEATPLRGSCLRVRCCAVFRRLSGVLIKGTGNGLALVLEVMLEVLQLRTAVRFVTTTPMDVYHSSMHVGRQLNIVESNTANARRANKQESTQA